jgi:tetratricopeptide (TPR) repeat protein
MNQYRHFPCHCSPTLLIVAWLFGATAAAADDKAPPDLLRSPAAKLETTAGSAAADAENVRALTDDDPATAGTFRATPQAPLELVWGFGGATVAPERLVVRLPDKPAANAGATTGATTGAATAAARVEVMVSQVSPHAGFQLLRADPLKPGPTEQQFKFPPTAARWVMLRFAPADKATSVSVAQVGLLGRDGPPQSHYAFKQTPAAAIQVLARLKALSALDAGVTEDEASMFADVKDGRFQKWSFEEAALLASGVGDRAARRAHLPRISGLVRAARDVTAGERTPFARGERLLKWLHAGPLAGGYKAHQTSLATVLDTGTYNCVSSATLYNIVGRAIGLDLRSIEVPDHAFSIIYDAAAHADVETTTPAGFNPARDKAGQEKFREQTGFTYLPDSHRDQRREIGEAALVAIIYYNRGVELSRAKRYHEALLYSFRAMSLDPEFASAVKNALAALAKWGADLADRGKFEEGLQVLTAGLELAPDDANLRHNRKVFWGQWAQAAAAAGKDDQALDVLRRAAKSVPDDAPYFLAQQAWVYLRAAEARLDRGEWEQALAAVEPGLTKLEGAPLEDLRRWRRDLGLRQCAALLKKREFQKAAAVLAAGDAQNPGDARYAEARRYVLQEWARDTFTSAGEQPARELLRGQLPQLAGGKERDDLVAGHVYWIVKRLRKDGRHEEALAAVDRHVELVADGDALKDLALSSVDARAEQLRKAGECDKALVVYETALGRWPADPHLAQNLTYTAQEGAKQILSKADEAEALKFVARAVERFPKVADLRKLARPLVGRAAERLASNGKFEDGLALVKARAPLLADDDAVQDCAAIVYDAWGRSLASHGKWQEATTVYGTGLERCPKDRRLRQNAIAAWNNWGKSLSDAGKWDEAIAVYENALKIFSSDGSLKRNLRIAKQRSHK